MAVVSWTRSCCLTPLPFVNCITPETGRNETVPNNALNPVMDSSVSGSYVPQRGSDYNGRFGCTCYHSLVKKE